VVNVHLNVTNNGIPNVNAMYSANNIDVMYQKIITGDFTTEDEESTNWITIKKGLQSVEGQSQTNDIVFPDGSRIGKGQTHTDAEMPQIIEYLSQYNGKPLLLQNAQNLIFHQASPFYARKFTDHSGMAEAEVPVGWTLITDGNSAILKITKISEENKSLSIDLANTDDRISLSQLNASKENQILPRQFTAGVGQTLTFKLTLKKNYNNGGGKLILGGNSNLLIDDVTPDDPSSGIDVQGTATTNLSQVNDTKQISYPPLTKDETFTIQAHMLYQNSQATKAGGASLVVSGNDTNGANHSASSPGFRLAGANFVMVDEKDHKFSTGSEFILARKLSSGYEIYTTSGNWSHVSSLSQLSGKSVETFKGGSLYTLGNNQSQAIPLNTQRFNFNVAEATKINQALIQIVGLPLGDNYLLYQPKDQTGSQDEALEFPFKVFSEVRINSIGNPVNFDSIGNAKIQDFKLNTAIPDFSASEQEYNVLSSNGKTTQNGSVTHLIIGSIVLVVVLVFGLVFVVARFL